jgi:probable phosphoglycerate mutase
MNRVFYIFRHGETNWNLERRCQGHTDIDLNENGKIQALHLAERMLDIPLDVIFSSDLTRAYKTGCVVAEKKGIPLILDKRLREMSYGEAEGMLYHEAVKIYGEELWNRFQTFSPENDHISFPGGETRKMARDRFHQSMLDIIETTSHKVIGLSTHGGALRNILHSFLPPDHQMLPIPNCVIYKCVYLFEKKSFVVDPFPS